MAVGTQSKAGHKAPEFGAAAMLASAAMAFAVSAVWWGPRAAALLGGALQDCLEDWEHGSMPEEERQRMLRQRAWRQGLTNSQRADWQQLLGPDLRALFPRLYTQHLEAQLLPSGECLHRRELIWVCDAEGAATGGLRTEENWRMCRAVFDPSIGEGVVIPACLAYKLGYTAQSGIPLLGCGRATGFYEYQLDVVPLSIGGHEFAETAMVEPAPVGTEQLPSQSSAGTDETGKDVAPDAEDVVRLSLEVMERLAWLGYELPANNPGEGPA